MELALTYRKTVKIFVGELIHWGIENKYIRFLFVGGVNASIYFVILLSCIFVTANYYLSVVISQILIAIIAYINFSFFSFRRSLSLHIFIRFCFSNVFLYFVSTLLVVVTRPLDISAFVFAVINVLVIAPLSYVLNSRLVFNAKADDQAEERHKAVLSAPPFGNVHSKKTLIHPFVFKGDLCSPTISKWLNKEDGPVSIMGAGQSYGDLGFSVERGKTFQSRRSIEASFQINPDRLTVIVDANVQIGLLHSKLYTLGYSLKVAPGAENASVGGCIAADVHGKNCHLVSSFGEHVTKFLLCSTVTESSDWCEKEARNFMKQLVEWV